MMERPRTARQLAEDRSQHAEPIPEGSKVAFAVDPVSFEARNFRHREACPRRADVDQRLDLEAVAVDVERRQAPPTEGVVTVAEDAVPSAVQELHHRTEDTVS